MSIQPYFGIHFALHLYHVVQLDHFVHCEPGKVALVCGNKVLGPVDDMLLCKMVDY